MTLTAGIHADIPPETYHADPCPEASLSSGMIKRLLTGSAAEAAAYHPRLTRWPELPAKAATKPQDLGAVVHSVVLGCGAQYVVGNPTDHRNKDGSLAKTWGSAAAAAWKVEQEANGLIVLGPEDGARVQAAADSMIALLRLEYGDWPIGDSEVVVIWQRETDFGPIWCRAMIDHLALRFMTVLDPKSTDWSIDNRSLQKMAAASQWHVQAAFYLDGLRAVLPASAFPDADEVGPSDLVGRLQFRFPVVEINPPYQARFYDLPPYWMEIAEEGINRACNTFAQGLRSGVWPPYPKVCAEPPPSYLANEYENRMLAIMEGRLESE